MLTTRDNAHTHSKVNRSNARSLSSLLEVRMRLLLPGILSSLAVFVAGVASAAETPSSFVTGMQNPESVCYGPRGLLYVTEIGEAGKNGDGKVSVIEDGKAKAFATGLDDPKGIVFFRDALYVTDVTRVVKVTPDGKTSVFLAPEAFPTPPLFLNDIAADNGNGILLITDSGDRKGKGGAVFRVDVRLNQVTAVVDTTTIPELNMPNGVTFEGGAYCVVVDMNQGALYRVRMHDKKAWKIAEGMDGADGLVWDMFGRLFITSWKTGKTFAIPRPGKEPILIGEGLKAAADCCLDSTGRTLLIPDMKSGTLTRLSTTIPGWEVDETPLDVKVQPAFGSLKWTGWDDGSESGKVVPLRPILLTHFGDGSNRIVVPTQHGVIHSFDNSDAAGETKILLDITDRVRYSDKQNEEGFLGLAFHPRFKENGELFVFYTDKKADLTNIVSRFRLKKGTQTVDPASEEELLRFEKPFWNHDGGTIAFGPDGYLYITHGDGGSGGDPKRNGQNLKTLLGKVLRIDVDKPAAGRKYGIPKDNPFATRADASPEIWAYGLRNIWRMAFDRQTGELWAGEVGQNTFEEVNIITAGGNYGWSVREALHPHGQEGVEASAEMIEPLWEYHHDIGKSITGGVVYRGKAIPELQGAYLYADYVTNRLWALRYDKAKGRVVANQPIECPNIGIMSFGEDQDGEVYVMGVSPTAKGIYRLTK